MSRLSWFVGRKGLLSDLVAGIILTAFVVVAAWYSIAIPVGEGVDEVAHTEYVKYVKDHMALPIQPWRNNGQAIHVLMGHHPPLYYAVGALVCFWCDLSDLTTALTPNPHFVWIENSPKNGWNVLLHSPAEAWPYRQAVLAIHYLRLWSVLMGGVTVLAVYRIGRLVLPDHPWIAVSGTALSAFNPSFVYMNSTIHHDPLITLIYALSLWWMARALRQLPTTRQSLLGGLLLGAGLLTKLSGLSLIPLFGLALLLAAWPKREWGWALRCGAILYGVALIMAGWWYVRNQILYDDPLGWAMFLSIFQYMARRDPYTWSTFTQEFMGQLSRTFWGAFGFMHITVPWAVSRFFWAAAGVSSLAAAAGIRFRRILLAGGRWRNWAILLGAALLVFAAFVRLSLGMVGAGQGRYLFTIVAPISLVLAVGLHTLTGFRWQAWVAGIVGIGMSVYAVWALAYFLLPLYAPPETAPPSDLATATPANIVFGDALELVAYRLGAPAVPPGQAVSLTLYWRAVGQQRPDLRARVQLSDRFGSVLIEDRFWPAPASSTAVWDVSTIYVTRRTLNLPLDAACGESSLEILVQKRGEDPLPARDAQGAALGPNPKLAMLFIGQISTVEASQVSIRYPRQERLGEAIRLLGYDLAPEPVRPGRTLPLTLYWQVSQAIDQNWTVFVHVLNERGELVAQQDNEPNGGLYPTSAWKPADIVRDPYAVPLPRELSPGRYSISIGMYEWPSLQRLPVTLNGVPQGDAITLGYIQVIR